MITAWLLNLGGTVVSWFVGLFPAWDEPSWLSGFPGVWNGLVGGASGLGAWIPWVIAFSVFGVVLSTYGVMFLVKIAMKLAAFIPFFGGSG